MSLSSVTAKIVYVGTGSTAAAAKVFAYPFKIFAATDLTVTEFNITTSAETVKVLTTDYDVSGVDAAGGGNVTLTGSYTHLPTDCHLVIQRVMDLTQETDYVENDPFPAETHEEALDKLTMITQQLQEQLDRAVLSDITATAATVSVIDSVAAAKSSAVVAIAQAVLSSAYAGATTTLNPTFVGNVTVSNSLTANGLFVTQSAELAATNYALSIQSTIAQTASSLMYLSQYVGSNQIALNIHNDGTGYCILLNQDGNATALNIDNAGTGVSIDVNQTVTAGSSAVEIDNDGAGYALYIHQDGVSTAANQGVYIYSNATQISADSALVKITQDHASSTEPALEIDNDGAGSAIEISTTSSSSHFRLTGDPANTDPADGDIWFDGTSLKIRIGSTTATLATD